MAKSTVKRPTRIKIGGVEVILQPQPLRQKGKLSDAQIRQAVMAGIDAEKSLALSRLKRKRD